MSTNCLVTKLKEIVNNDNLPFYGENSDGIVLNTYNISANTFTIYAGADDVHFETDLPVSFNNEEVTSGVIPANTSKGIRLLEIETDVHVKFWPQYNIVKIMCNCLKADINLNSIKSNNENINVESDMRFIHGDFAKLDKPVIYTAIANNLYFPIPADGSYHGKLDITEFKNGNAFILANNASPGSSSFSSRIDVSKFVTSFNVSTFLSQDIIKNNITQLNIRATANSASRIVPGDNLANALANCPNIEIVSLTGPRINIVDTFTQCTGLSALDAIPTVTGEDLKPMFDAWAAAGKTGTMRFSNAKNITINGVTPTSTSISVTFAEGSYTWENLL